MSLARRIALVVPLLVALLAAPLAVSAFWAGHALTDSDGYAEQMKDAWKTGGVKSEIDALVTAAATEKVQQYFDVSGSGENFLADFAQNFLTGQIETGLASGAFVKAWTDWHRQLHQDLATIVLGGDPELTTVQGSTITTDLTPLVSVLFSGTVGEIVKNALGTDVLVQKIELDYDIEEQLQSLGDLWAARWWAVLAALACLAVATLLARPHLRGTALTLLAGAAGCLAAWVWRLVPAPAGDAPATAISEAITDAMVGSWSTWLLVAWVGLGLLGAALLLAPLLGARTTPAAPDAPDA